MRHPLAILILAAFASPAFASAPLASVNSAVSSLCGGLVSLLPIAAMLGVVLGGVIYGLGQIMGAETRARANVWATAALTGAIIAVLITVVAPAVLETVYGGTILGPSEVRRLKQLEDENRRLKQMVADLSLDKQLGCLLQNEIGQSCKQNSPLLQISY